jgi:coenzyme Q-binding protein COQ10
VGGVEAYPDFVPWVTDMRTWNARPLGEGIEAVDAEVKVGFSFLKERFATRVVRNMPARRIEVSLLYGPFRRLENRWRFEDDGAGGTLVVFDIDFQFKSRLLDALLAANFGLAVGRLIGCFEARARSLYGA